MMQYLPVMQPMLAQSGTFFNHFVPTYTQLSPATFNTQLYQQQVQMPFQAISTDIQSEQQTKPCRVKNNDEQIPAKYVVETKGCDADGWTETDEYAHPQKQPTHDVYDNLR